VYIPGPHLRENLNMIRVAIDLDELRVLIPVSLLGFNRLVRAVLSIYIWNTLPFSTIMSWRFT
jgi:hypothetical protein